MMSPPPSEKLVFSADTPARKEPPASDHTSGQAVPPRLNRRWQPSGMRSLSPPGHPTSPCGKSNRGGSLLMRFGCRERGDLDEIVSVGRQAVGSDVTAA